MEYLNIKFWMTEKMEWKILKEQQKIGEFNTQKAETNFAGRKWIAWFTSDIPFQDGPVQIPWTSWFNCKIESADKTHSMELKGVKKTNRRTAYNKQYTGVIHS